MLNINRDAIDILNKNTFLTKNSFMLESMGTLCLALAIDSPEYIALSAISFGAVLYKVKNAYNKQKRKIEFSTLLDYNKYIYGRVAQLEEEYIYHVARIISNYEFKDNMQLCSTLKCLLYDGAFSFNDYEFDVPKNILGEVEEIAASYVIDGKCCCRHISNFMSKLLTKLGIPNLCVDVDTKIINTNKADHVLNLIVDKDRLFAYDFTWGTPLNINLKKYNIKGVCYEKETNSFKYAYDKIVKFICFSNVDDIYKYTTHTFDDEEIMMLEYVGQDLARIIKRDMENDPFFEHMNELKKEISSKSLQLVPRRK